MTSPYKQARREDFVHQLAVYLSGNAAEMSILLEMHNPHAQVWARVRGALPHLGWATVEETEVFLNEFLFDKKDETGAIGVTPQPGLCNDRHARGYLCVRPEKHEGMHHSVSIAGFRQQWAIGDSDFDQEDE